MGKTEKERPGNISQMFQVVSGEFTPRTEGIVEGSFSITLVCTNCHHIIPDVRFVFIRQDGQRSVLQEETHCCNAPNLVSLELYTELVQSQSRHEQ